MNFLIEKIALENMLSSLQPFLEKKDNAEITSHIYFEVRDSKLVLKATDYETGLEINHTNVTTTSEGIATCNGKKILDIVRILKDGEVNLYFENDEIHIKQNRSKYKLPSFNAEEFPNFPSLENLPKIDINSSKLMNGFKKVNPTIATNNPKFELNGALLDIRNSVINIVSTDTRRLAVFKISSDSEKLLSLIIPKKAISEIQKIFSNDIEILYDETNFIIKGGNYYFFTKVINGNFPDYERIIPRELKHNFTLPKMPIIDAIKQVNIITPEIKITFDSGKMIFESISNENMEAKTELEVNVNLAEPFSVAINSRYVIDFLSNIDTDDFKIGFNEPNTPFELKSENFLTIIMPIIL